CEALERAEQERAGRFQAAPGASTSAPDPPVPESAPDPGLRSLPELPRGAANGLEEHLVSLLAPTSFEAEQYRALRHLIEQLHKSTGLVVVAVSSPTVAYGKTTTSINLDGALAHVHDYRVLSIHVDLYVHSIGLSIGTASGR